MYVLATGRGTVIAARLGLPVVIGGPILAEQRLDEVLESYRRDFRPSPGVERPYVVVSLDVTVADDDLTARELALPEAWAMARSRQTGEFPPLEPAAEIRRQPWTAQLTDRVEESLDRAVAGAPRPSPRARAARREDRRRRAAGSTSTYDREALFASDAALRELVA